MADTIELRQTGEDLVTARGLGYLRDFSSYLAACKAAAGRFDGGSRAWRVPLARAAGLRADLESAGYQVVWLVRDLPHPEEEPAARPAPPDRPAPRPDPAASVEALVATRVATWASWLDAHLARLDPGLRPYPFQRSGAAWLATRSKALLLDEMGLGKTAQVLLALGPAPAALVVAPAVVVSVWAAEAARWRPDLRVEVLRGRGSTRWPAAGELFVTTWDVAAPPADAPLRPAHPVALVLDEAHYGKTATAARTKRARALAAGAEAAGGRTWALTATPIPNRPPDLLAVCRLAGLTPFGDWSTFCRLFHGRKGRFGHEWAPRPPLPEAAERLARVALRRQRADVLPDLPVKRWQDHTVDVDRAAARACDRALAALEAAGLTIEDVADAAGRANGGATDVGELSAALAALATAKLPAALELVGDLEDAGEPVVLFSAHRAPVDAMAAREGWAVITGDTPAAERAARVAAFQAGELRGLALTIQAGGVGITLTRAAHAVLVDETWSPAESAQAEDRLCRIGQTRGVVVHRIVADHDLDRQLRRALAVKRARHEAAVEAAAVTT